MSFVVLSVLGRTLFIRSGVSASNLFDRQSSTESFELIDFNINWKHTPIPTQRLLQSDQIIIAKLLEVGTLQVAEQLPKKSVPSVRWRPGCPSA